MVEIVNMEKMYKELIALKKEVHFIKTHMFDSDSIMTAEEEVQLEKALEEHEQGKTISLEDLKEELGN
jgi:hypothetical protein|tara:strand:+ start:457 stop:660 length:204 start_codon:yes stop_codon:yes gene_type:complete